MATIIVVAVAVAVGVTWEPQLCARHHICVITSRNIAVRYYPHFVQKEMDFREIQKCL